MNWEIIFQDDFNLEFDELNELVQDECFANLKVLEKFGPELGRPHVDTLKGSKHSNMKELRFNADNGVWRLAFAFDPTRRAILLICGDKTDGSEKRFYKDLIKKADQRFDKHLSNLKTEVKL
ncbi:type II toxin-antitoxin system RelE/ParE family toxin [Legionella rowbothamii]|uniref:type II toxin-antitoxin system RelE/ParE family toxin n=1 Tax=Legionella rowbothamii TaxID=96229 RepID=UPI0010543D46|nr:type II toxin-antitoxin system RelE/ParE family toxin [Legionella rowbothamii]